MCVCLPLDGEKKQIRNELPCRNWYKFSHEDGLAKSSNCVMLKRNLLLLYSA